MENPRIGYGCIEYPLCQDAVFLLEAAGIPDGSYQPVYITDQVNSVPLDSLKAEDRTSFEAQRMTLNDIVFEACKTGAAEIRVIGVGSPKAE